MSGTRAAERLKAEKAALQADAVRHDILLNALALFAHYGFAKTNIGDIAERCGMSPGNLYRYYRNKQAIGLAVIESFFEMKQTEMDTVLMLPVGTTEERIRRFLVSGTVCMKREIEQTPKIVELAEFLMEDEQGLELLGAHIAWKRGRLKAEIEKGIAAGELAPCDAEHTAATMLNGLKVFFMPTTLIRWRDRSTIIPELEDILDLMFRGLRSR